MTRFYKDREDIVHSVDAQRIAHLSWTHCGYALYIQQAYEMRDGRPENVTCKHCIALGKAYSGRNA